MQDDKLVRVLKALSDTKRFRMIKEVAAAGELTCGQIGEKFSLSQPTISHHLKLLLDVGVLRVRQDGQNHFLSVDEGLLSRVFGSLPLRLNQAPAQGTPRKRGKASGAVTRLETARRARS